MVVFNEDDYLSHYGILRKSGRYPWGSGKDPQARGREFNRLVDELKKQGMSQVEIAKTLGFVDEKTGKPSTTNLRSTKTIANNAIKAADQAMAFRLQEKGYSPAAGARKMNIPDSTYRALIAPGEKDKTEKLANTAEMLRQAVADKGLVGVGSGTANYLGIAPTKLNTAIAILRDEGYSVQNIPIPQLGTGKNTNVKVLAPPGTTWGEIKKRQNEIKELTAWSEDYGETFTGRLKPPISINPRRIDIMWKEDGGATQDGMVYLRPGVKDISLDQSRYAQVRVLVGDSHYLKGMAMYKDDLPDGVDIMFATNKSNTGNKFDAMKKLKDEPQIETNNPFGSSIKRQILERNAKGEEVVTSAMNIVNEQGDWGKWSKNLSSQVLSKQPLSLAKTQLEITFNRKQKEYEDILALTNPTVRKHLLEKFSDEADTAAVHLKAAALNNRQAYHVILPIPSMKPNEVYAPNYKPGELVALIRYPHGGTFEIPELVVNNSNKEAKRLLGDVPDAIGIHHSVAERLSGADFDGDQVVVVPNSGTKRIKSTPALEGLKDFDAKASYPKYDGMKVISPSHKQTEMGVVSNLITDMTIKLAPPDEIARAVRHSMVIIDAEKHELNYRQSAIDNGISNLKDKYQRQPDGRHGAATLISRAGSERIIPELKGRLADEGGPIDRETGKLVLVPSGKTRRTRDGEVVPVVKSYKALAITDDAHTLSSGTPIETVYANHSNKLKSLANESRKTLINTPDLKYDASANRVYHKEVAELNQHLDAVERNRPRERQAVVLSNAIYRAKLNDNPGLDKASQKKLRNQALTEARIRTGAVAPKIKFTQSQWDAIQAGAITPSKLKSLLDKADLETVRKLATPKPQRLMTATNTARAKAMLARGVTRAEVAAALGVSLTTLDNSINGEQ